MVGPAIQVAELSEHWKILQATISAEDTDRKEMGITTWEKNSNS